MSTNDLNAPPFLKGISRSAVDSIDVQRAISDALEARGNRPALAAALLALNAIESYSKAAQLQQRRIRRINAAMRDSMWSRRSARGASVFTEAHFYVVCWARIQKLLDVLKTATQFKRLGRVLRPYNSTFRDFKDARDHLEHFEERFPGGRSEAKLQDRRDLLNMMNDSLTFGGKSLDVGPRSACCLREIIARVRLAVLYDSLETLAETDQGRLRRLVRRAVQDVQIARINRKLNHPSACFGPSRPR